MLLSNGLFWKPEEKFKSQKGIIDTELDMLEDINLKSHMKKFAKETRVMQKLLSYLLMKL